METIEESFFMYFSTLCSKVDLGVLHTTSDSCKKRSFFTVATPYRYQFSSKTETIEDYFPSIPRLSPVEQIVGYSRYCQTHARKWYCRSVIWLLELYVSTVSLSAVSISTSLQRLAERICIYFWTKNSERMYWMLQARDFAQIPLRER